MRYKFLKIQTIKKSFLKLFIFTSFVLTGLHIQVEAQNGLTNDLSIGINYNKGYIIPEYPFLNYIVDDYFHSVEILFFKQTTGKKFWDQIYNYPYYGLGIKYSYLGNQSVLGKELALFGFFRIDIINRNWFKFYNSTGIGADYVTKIYDTEDNYLNVAVGSHFNVHFNTKFGMGISLSEKIEINSGIAFSHFSNANMVEPNLGLNAIGIYGGLNYNIGEKTPRKTFDIKSHEKTNYLVLFLSVGGKHTRALSTDIYSTSSVALELHRKIVRCIHIGMGVDLFYDSSVKPKLETDNKKYLSKYSFQTGFHISQTFVYNRFNIVTQEGVYVLLTEKLQNKPFYTRGIFKYHINEKLSIRIAMKSHLHILDYPEIGIGIKL